MAIKLTADSFVSVLRRSGLMEGAQIDAQLSSFEQAGVDLSRPDAIAEALVDSGVLSDWQADKLLKGKHKGFFLGKYRLHSLLGKGGMSSVYLAEHIVMRRRCAIKVLPSKRVKQTSYLARFHREAQAVAALDHPNIVRAYDVDREVDRDHEIHYLVMEYVEGRELQEIVDTEGPLPCARAARYIQQAARGLHHAHKAGLVHRDVKPSNLLIDQQDVVKILDLGLARLFNEDDSSSVTMAHDEVVLGTADYLAPEQAVNSHNVDPRADIYSLGCTFYFALTGHPPFQEGTLAQRLLAHQHETPPPIEADRSDVPEDLRVIVYKMMEKSPADRFASARDVVRLLSKWLGNHEGEAGEGDEPRNNNATAVSTETNRPEGPADVAGRRGTVKEPLRTSHSDRSPGPSQPQHSDARPHTPATNAASTSSVRVSRDDSLPIAKPVPPVATPPDSGNAAAAVTSAKDSTSVPTESPAASVESGKTPGEFRFAIDDNPVDQALANRSSRRGRDLPFSRRTLVAAAAGLLAIVAVVAAIIFWPDTPPEEPDPDGVGDEAGLTEVMTVGPDGDFQSISAGLEFVREHFFRTDWDVQTIRVAPGTYREHIKLIHDPLDPFPANVHLVADGDVTLIAKSREPVVVVDQIRQFVMRGFTIDGTANDTAIRISGHLPGTSFENMTIRNFQSTGLLCKELSAFEEPEREFRLSNLVFEGDSALAVGIRFQPDPSSPAFANASVVGCRFQGPLKAGIELADYANNVHIRECIFASSEAGIRIRGASPVVNGLVITNNTFFSCGNGIVFEQMPSSGGTGLQVQRNLFSNIRTAEAVCRSGYDPKTFELILNSGGSPVHNWTDNDMMGEKAIDLFRRGRTGVVDFGFQSTEPGSDAFLAPSETSPHREIESGSGKLKPYIGAVGPK